jgi:hypothetical protein
VVTAVISGQFDLGSNPAHPQVGLAFHPSAVNKNKDQSYWKISSGALQCTDHVFRALKMFFRWLRIYETEISTILYSSVNEVE